MFFLINPLYVYLNGELLCLVGDPESKSRDEAACLVGRKSAWRCLFSPWGIPSRHHGCFDASRHGHP